MSGRIYFDRCPVHQTDIKTDRVKKFCAKKGGPIYDAPIFFCNKCKTYYAFIKELEVTFKGTAKESDGYPIKVLGKKPVPKPVREVKNTAVASKKKKIEIKQKPTKKQQQKKKKETFSTFCPEHDIVLRTPVMWKTGIPLFYCQQCEKYYISSNLYPFGHAVGRLRERLIINTDLMVIRRPEPEHKKNNGIEEQTDLNKREPLENITNDKSVTFFANSDIDSTGKAVPDKKAEDLETGENEDYEHTELDTEMSEPPKETLIPDVSQRNDSELGTVTGRKFYIDDFNVEFDFSEFESFLIL